MESSISITSNVFVVVSLEFSYLTIFVKATDIQNTGKCSTVVSYGNNQNARVEHFPVLTYIHTYITSHYYIRH